MGIALFPHDHSSIPARVLHLLQTIFVVLVPIMASCKPAKVPLQQLPQERGGSKPFKVVVAGEGITRDRTAKGQIYPLNRSEAAAMAKGVALAYENATPTLQRFVKLVRHDDRGDKGRARQIARSLQFDPYLLAVIGHSSSGATGEALREYQAAGIPVLMPIATSPHVRSRVAHRLPLNDRDGQAPALIHFITDSLKARKLHIVQDLTADAGSYTQPLVDYLEEILPAPVFNLKDEIRLEDGDFARTCHKIKANRSDVVLFVGYASTAVTFIDYLREEFLATAQSSAHKRNIAHPTPSAPGDRDLRRPVLVFTDGTISEDLRPQGFELYVSAPFPSLVSEACSQTDFPNALNTMRRSLPNYEPFGYDAALILNQAMHLCENQGEISRSCLIEQLRHGKFRGLCNDYYFSDGENQEGQYTVFAVEEDAEGDLLYKPEKSYDIGTLRELKETLEEMAQR